MPGTPHVLARMEFDRLLEAAGRRVCDANCLLTSLRLWRLYLPFVYEFSGVESTFTAYRVKTGAIEAGSKVVNAGYQLLALDKLTGAERECRPGDVFVYRPEELDCSVRASGEIRTIAALAGKHHLRPTGPLRLPARPKWRSHLCVDQ